jgi:hypothetical protein
VITELLERVVECTERDAVRRLAVTVGERTTGPILTRTERRVCGRELVPTTQRVLLHAIAPNDGAACPTAATECSTLGNAVVRYGAVLVHFLTRTADYVALPDRVVVARGRHRSADWSRPMMTLVARCDTFERMPNANQFWLPDELGNCAQTLQFGRPYFVPMMQRATPGILTLPSSS